MPLCYVLMCHAGYAAIHYAALGENADMVHFVMARGENIDRPFPSGTGDLSGRSPLMLAMEMSGGKLNNTIEVRPLCALKHVLLLCTYL